MILLVAEDEGYANFLPLTYTKAVFELKCGAYSLVERLRGQLPGSRLQLTCRGYLARAVARRLKAPVNRLEEVDEEALLVSGRLVPREVDLGRLAVRGVVWTVDGSFAASLLPPSEVEGLWGLIEAGRLNEVASRLRERGYELRALDGATLIGYPWQLVELTPQLLPGDLARMAGRGGGVVEDGAVVKGDRGMLIIDEGATIEPYVVIDVRRGPVYVGEGSVVHAGSRIEGPSFIGRGVLIQGAYVRAGCVIGDMCRLGGGGEVEETVIHGFTNKHHYGFIGHSYIGEWVNLAAGTTNSDLKNTYGTVRVAVGSLRVDTGLLKVGCFIADHAKTSIGSMIYTGVKVGVCSHVHGFVVRDVPSFTIWAESLGRRPTELKLESAIETARRMRARRSVELSVEEEEVLREVFRATVEERRRLGVVSGEFKL